MPNLGKIATNMNMGLNEQASQTIQQNEVSVSENFIYHDRAASVREGYQVFGSLPAPVVALRKFYNKDGGNYFTAIAGGQFYNCVTSGSFTSVSTAPVSGTVHTEIYGGAVYFTDYASPVKYFDGEVVDVAGVSSPVFRKQINDFEDVTQWTVSLQGSIAEDRHYTHIDHGKKAITFSASSPSIAATFGIGGSVEMLATIQNNVYENPWRGKNICRNLSGNINVFYSVNSAFDNNIHWAQSFNQGSTWTKTYATSNSSQTQYFQHMPSCAIDSSNNIHLSYLGTSRSHPDMYHVFINKYTVLSGWVETYITSAWFSPPNVAVNASNDAYFVFHTWSLNYINLQCVINHALSGVTSISTITQFSSPGGTLWCPNLTIDRSSIVHVAWVTQDVTSPYPNLGNVNLYYKKSTANTVNLGSFYHTLDIPDQQRFPGISLVIDTSSNVHIASVYGYVSSYYDIAYFRYANTNANWSGPIQITTDGISGYFQQNSPQVSMDQNNKLNVFWHGKSINSPFYNQIRYTTYLSGWGTVVDLTNAKQQQNYPSPIWSFHPVASSARCNLPNTGWAYAWFDGDSIKYHASYDLLWTSSPVAPRQYDLTHFASDVSSDLQDIVQVYTCHNVKKNISSIVLQFIDTNSYTASQEITNLSSWQSCSNDEWGLTHNIPKAVMTLSNTSFNWASCNLQIQMTALSSLNVSTQVVAKCAIDNLRMIKTPPIADHSTSTKASSDLLFFGSSATAGLQNPSAVPSPTIRVFAGYDFPENNTNPIGNPTYQDVPNPLYQAYLDGTYIPPAPALDSMGQLQLQGLKMVSDPLPSGTYYYKATFLKESPSGMEIESTPSFQSSSFMVSNDISSWTYIQLVNIPIAPDSMGVVGRRIYRRRSDESLFRSCYTIGDNQTTNFLDTVPNITLGKGLEDDHTPPPKAKFITKASNQLVYYANIVEQGVNYPSRVRFSLPYEPYYCPLQNTLDVSSDDGQEITGQFEFNGIIHVLKDCSTFVVNKGIPQNIHTTIGCIAPHSIAVGRSEVFWLSEDGIIKYRLYQFQNVSHSINKQSIYRIQAVLDRLPKEYLSNARGTYYNGLYLLSVTDAGSVTNNLVLCYDIDADVWSIFPNLNVNCWETWSGSQEGYRLFFGNNSGLICEMFTGDYDISTPIYSKIRCKDFGIPTPQELPRKSFLFMQDLDGQPKTMNVTPIYDFVAQSNYPGQYPVALTSGQNNLMKIDLQMDNPVSFFSMQFEASGRYKINQLEIYAKPEKLR